MLSYAVNGTKEQIQSLIAQAMELAPSLVLLFADPEILRDQQCQIAIADGFAGVPCLGCSTAGEICGPNFSTNSISLLALKFSKTTVRVAQVTLASADESFNAASELADRLKGPKLKGVFVFGPGTRINGSAVVRGLSESLGKNVVIAGGLAADRVDFKSTVTFCNGTFSSDSIVAVGLYGDDIVLSCGAEGGWRPFGPARRVTKAQDNILFELDGKPALQLYKQYLGEKARQLPASGLAYPFAVLREDRSTSGIIRSALAINHELEAIVLAGDITQGCKVCLMHADANALTQSAAQAAAEALRTHAGPEENGCALVISCVGRRMVLGIDVEDEIEAVVDSFLPATPIAGFYAYGEISSHQQTGRSELHNQTFTVVYITEKGEQP